MSELVKSPWLIAVVFGFIFVADAVYRWSQHFGLAMDAHSIVASLEFGAGTGSIGAIVAFFVYRANRSPRTNNSN